MGSAYAEFQEKEKGSITPGKLADFVVLSDDIFKIPPAAIKNVKSGGDVSGWEAGVWRAGVVCFNPECKRGIPICHPGKHKCNDR